MFDQGPIGDKRGRVRIDCYDDPLWPMNGINSPKGCSAESMTLNTITGGDATRSGSRLQLGWRPLVGSERCIRANVITRRRPTMDQNLEIHSKMLRLDTKYLFGPPWFLSNKEIAHPLPVRSFFLTIFAFLKLSCRIFIIRLYFWGYVFFLELWHLKPRQTKKT